MFRVQALAVAAMGAMLCLGQVAMAQSHACACGRLTHLTQALNLTPAQQAQAQQIFQSEHQQMSAVLTPAQRASFKARRDAFQTAMSSLNLSADQQAKVAEIRQDAQTKAQAINNDTTLSSEQKRSQLRDLRKATHDQIVQLLTPAQQTQLQTALQAARGTGRRPGASLTAAQRTQLRQIHTQAMANFRAILTPAQQQQFDQLQASRHQCHAAAAG